MPRPAALAAVEHDGAVDGRALEAEDDGERAVPHDLRVRHAVDARLVAEAELDERALLPPLELERGRPVRRALRALLGVVAEREAAVVAEQCAVRPPTRLGAYCCLAQLLREGSAEDGEHGRRGGRSRRFPGARRLSELAARGAALRPKIELMPGLKLNLGAVQANEPSPEKPVAIAPTPREEIVAKLKQQEAEEAVARLEESNRFALAGKLEQVRSELVVGVARAAKREARMQEYTAANERQNEELAAATKSAMAEMARLHRGCRRRRTLTARSSPRIGLRAAEDELHEIQHETSRLSDDTQLLRRRFVKTREALQTTTEALHVGELDMKDYFFMPASRVVPGSQLDALPLVAAESERIAALARRGATQKSAEAAV